MEQILGTIGARSAASSRAPSSSSGSGRSASTWSSSGWRRRTGRSGTCSSGRTTRSCRTSPSAGIILFTPLFFVLAVWVYKIVRPHEKIGEVWERNLAEEALLAEVESIHHCPTCERRIDDEWIICPTCRTRLNRVCPNCSRLVGLDWSLCAWCGKDFERREVAAAAIGRCRQAGTRPGGSPHPAARPRPPPRPRRPSRRLPASPARTGARRDRPAPSSRPSAGPAARALSPPDGPTDPDRTGSTTARRAGRCRRRVAAPTGRSAERPPRRPPYRRPAPAAAPVGEPASRRPAAPRPSRSRAARRPACSSSAGWRRSLGFGIVVVGVLSGGERRCHDPDRRRAGAPVGRPGRRGRVAGHRAAARGHGWPIAGRRRSSSSRRRSRSRSSLSIALGVPLVLVGVPVDGPFGGAAVGGLQALVYVALIRLLVVDTGALDWRAMGIVALDGWPIGEMIGGALWAVPVIVVTIPSSPILLRVLSGHAREPVAPDRRDRRVRPVAAGRGGRRAVRRGDPVPRRSPRRPGCAGSGPPRPHRGGARLRVRPRPDHRRARRR